MQRLALLALLLLACTPTSHSSASDESNDAWFFATVNQTGVPHCPNDDDIEWLAKRPLLGLTGVSGAGVEQLDAYLGKPVLVRGNAGTKPPPGPPVEADRSNCSFGQARRDWIETPNGTIMDRGNHPQIEHFHMTSVRPLDELQVRLDDDELIVELENPLPFALDEIQFVVFYEGCYGKPGTTSISSDTRRLRVGKRMTERFPLIAEDDGGKTEGRAGSVMLLGKGEPGKPEVHFDIDVSLAVLGIPFECPE